MEASAGGGILGQIGAMVGDDFRHQCLARQAVDRPAHRAKCHPLGDQQGGRRGRRRSRQIGGRLDRRFGRPRAGARRAGRPAAALRADCIAGSLSPVTGGLQQDIQNNARQPGKRPKCPAPHKLQPVLDRIDGDFDNSLQRLFALLRIKSISADPAFAGDCKAAADHLARDIATLGFATEVRPTAGHPAIVAKANGSKDGATARAVLRSLRCTAGRSAQSLASPALRTRRHRSRRRAKDHRRARRRGRQGPVDDLRRGLPGLEVGHGFAAGRHHHHHRGRGGNRIEKFRAVSRAEQARAQGGLCAGLRHRHVGPEYARDHHLAARARLRRGADQGRQSRPAFRHVRRRRAKSDPGVDPHPRRAV